MYKGIVWGDGNVQYFGWGDGYMGVSTYQDSLNCRLKLGTFLLYVNYTAIKLIKKICTDLNCKSHGLGYNLKFFSIIWFTLICSFLS